MESSPSDTNVWKPSNMRNCSCRHCGGNAEPLLMSMGQLGIKVDKMIVAHEEGSGKPITVKDLRMVPKRPRHRPELTLAAALMPLVAAITLKATPDMMNVISEMGGAQGGYGPMQVNVQAALGDFVTTGLPWVCGIASALMLGNAIWKVIDNQRMIEQEEREIRLANQLLALRKRADNVVACGWCNQMSAPGHDKLEIRADLLRAVIEGKAMPSPSMGFLSPAEQNAYFSG